MSNTAFALSPISARATSPTEADFEAIREAFVETARGRWFLEEYTKRNRNADTALVLDAVARIERTLAAQKELKTEEPQAPSAPDLSETLPAIKVIIAAARKSAEAALSGPPMDEALAPTRKCARVIREIAWGLRESGADGRICSLLDSQVDAINAACDRITTSGFRDTVLEAFDLVTVQIDQLGVPGGRVAEIRQPDVAIVADGPRNTSREIVEETQGASSNVSPHVSNDNNASSFDAAMLPAAAPSSDVPTTSADSEHAPSEVAASQGMTAEDLASETNDGIALDEGLFDLTAESTVRTSREAEAYVEVQDPAAADVMETSAAIESPTDVTVETAAAEEAIQQTTPTPEPEVAASEPEQNECRSIAPVITTGDITVVPKVVESLEEMADIAIEETAPDEALADQDRTSDTIAVVAQDELTADNAPQIAEQFAEPVVISDISEAAVSDAEQNATSNAVSVTPSEDAPSMTPDEAPPSVSAKTPLPDNMLGEAIAQNSYSTAGMDVSVAVEAAAVSVANDMMSLAAGPTPDAITPPISLGASLIASGIVAKPETPRNDPLAAIRRMSHAERIAFFS